MATDYREYNLSYTAEEVDDKLGIINTSKNLLPYPYIVGSLASVNGLTFVDNGDGSITVNGSITNPSTAKTVRLTTLSLPAGTYTASGSSDNTKVFLRVTFGNTSYSIFSTATFTVTENTSVAVDLYIEGNSGEVIDIQNITIKPQIEQGDTFTGWEPYIESINSYVYNHFEGLTKKINDKLSTSDLDSAVEDALLKAKQTGEFDGKDGQDGEDGTSVNHTWSGTTLIVTSASGTTSADLKGDKGDKGDRGEKGDTGNSNIYIGTGEMPEGYEVQIDPTADPDLLTGQTINDSENYFYNETVGNALNQLGHSQIIDAGTFASTDEITSYNWEGNKFYKFTLNCYSGEGFNGDCIGLFDSNSSGGFIYFYNLTTGLSGWIQSKWGAGVNFLDSFTYSKVNSAPTRVNSRLYELTEGVNHITACTEVNNADHLASYIETVPAGTLFSVRFSSGYHDLPMHGRCLCIKLPVYSDESQKVQYLNLETGAIGIVSTVDRTYESIFDPVNKLDRISTIDSYEGFYTYLNNLSRGTFNIITLTSQYDSRKDTELLDWNTGSDYDDSYTYFNKFTNPDLLTIGTYLVYGRKDFNYAANLYHIYINMINLSSGDSYALRADGASDTHGTLQPFSNIFIESSSIKQNKIITNDLSYFNSNNIEDILNELGSNEIKNAGLFTSLSAFSNYSWEMNRAYVLGLTYGRSDSLPDYYIGIVYNKGRYGGSGSRFLYLKGLTTPKQYQINLDMGNNLYNIEPKITYTNPTTLVSSEKTIYEAIKNTCDAISVMGLRQVNSDDAMAADYGYLLANIVENITCSISSNQKWTDMPTTYSIVFSNRRYSANYNIQLAFCQKTGTIWYRLVNKNTAACYINWQVHANTDNCLQYRSAYTGATGATAVNNLLSNILDVGVFAFNPGLYTDMPANYPSTGGSVVINVQQSGNYGTQILLHQLSGRLWTRIINRSTKTVHKDWSETGTDARMKVLALGDSICRGYRNNEKGYVGELGILNYKNIGVSGASVSNIRSDVTNIPDQLINLSNTETNYIPDVIIGEGGINDYFSDAPLGELSASPVFTDEQAEALNRDTVLGGLEYLFYKMISLYPKAQRFFVITHKTWKTNESIYCPTEQNTQGWTQQDLHDAIIKCCNLYNVKAIDVYNDSMMNTLFNQYRSTIAWSTDNSITDTEYCDLDGVHPLAYGYRECYVPLIKAALKIGTTK